MLLLGIISHDGVWLIGSRGLFRGTLSVAARKNWQKAQRITFMGLFKYPSVGWNPRSGRPAHGQPLSYLDTEMYK